jgi:chitin disaccharide deacetylase
LLIINADDFGKNRGATDRILLCFKSGRITSATAMMFMADTERSARIAAENKMEIGLHLNLTDEFVGVHNVRLEQCRRRISTYLRGSRISRLLYNPFLKNDFEYLCRTQWDRFVSLYKKPPSHVDGHRHMHLCANVLLPGAFPDGIRMRRNFHFTSGEKGLFNRLARKIIDKFLQSRFSCVDYFFSVKPIDDLIRLKRIIDMSQKSQVELMAHPDQNAEFIFLMSNPFRDLLSNITMGSYSMISTGGNKQAGKSESAWTAER